MWFRLYMMLNNSLEGSSIASRDWPLNFQISATVNRDRGYSVVFFHFVFFVWASRQKTSPVIRLDKQMQVELVHVILDVLSVRCDQVVVVVDLFLHTNSQNTVTYQTRDISHKKENANKICTFPKRWLMIMSVVAWAKLLSWWWTLKTTTVSFWDNCWTTCMHVCVCFTLCAAQSIHPSAHGLMLMSISPSTMLGKSS